MTNLNPDQLMAVMQNAPELDIIAKSLLPFTQQELLKLQIRAGQDYNAGEWNVPETGEKFSNPPTPDSQVTAAEARMVLGLAVLELDIDPVLPGDKKQAYINTLEKMGGDAGLGSLKAQNAAIIESIKNKNAPATEPLRMPVKSTDTERSR